MLSSIFFKIWSTFWHGAYLPPALLSSVWFPIKLVSFSLRHELYTIVSHIIGPPPGMRRGPRRDCLRVLETFSCSLSDYSLIALATHSQPWRSRINLSISLLFINKEPSLAKHSANVRSGSPGLGMWVPSIRHTGSLSYSKCSDRGSSLLYQNLRILRGKCYVEMFSFGIALFWATFHLLMACENVNKSQSINEKKRLIYIFLVVLQSSYEVDILGREFYVWHINYFTARI